MFDWIDKYKVVRRLILIWAVWLITWVTFAVFDDPPDIAGSTAAALGTIVGILATVIAFYQSSRFKEDEECCDDDK